MEKIKKAFLFVLENGTSILTVLFASYILLMSQRSTITQDEMLVWILTVVGLLSTSELIEKLVRMRKIEDISKRSHDLLVTHFQSKPSAETFLFDRTTQTILEDRLSQANAVYMTGGSLTKVLSLHIGLIEEKAKRGCKFKFLIVDPESEACALTAHSIVYEIRNPQAYSAQIRMSLEMLGPLLTQYNQATKQVEVRLCDFVPTYSFMMTDADSQKGKIWIEWYPYKSPVRTRPNIALERTRDGHWYEYFNEQFNAMWQASKPWEPYEHKTTKKRK